MTTQPLRSAQQHTGVRCPICLTEFHRNDREQVLVGPDGATVAPALPGELPDDRTDRLSRARRRCPGTENSPEHYLPYFYDDPDPILLGVIGSRATGKTHLLAAMVSQLTDTAVQDRLEIRVDPMDPVLHGSFVAQFVRPFMNERRVLALTPAVTYALPVDMFEITDRNRRRFTLVLFDVDGEALRSPELALNFLVVANALMFVVDPDQIKGLALSGTGTQNGDRSFEVVVDRVQRSRRTRGQRYTHLPAALVVAKADKLTGRGHELADKWMGTATPPAEGLDAGRLAEECEDVWAYLSVFQAMRWLNPARQLAPATLHFASAAGTDPLPSADGSGSLFFPESGFRQIRVLRPLLALLGAHGVAMRGWERPPAGGPGAGR